MPEENPAAIEEYWRHVHERYADADWIARRMIFAEQAIQYFPATGALLELGGGQGQDARFFAGKGYEVTLTDFSDTALALAREKNRAAGARITVQSLDLAAPLPWADGSFDIVYAHLSIHYFDTRTTRQIFAETNRILAPGGIAAFLVNSIHDPEYAPEKEEDGLIEVGGIRKRFFSVESMREFAEGFEILLLDDAGETYKDRAIGTTNLVRFVGRKPAIFD